MGWVGLVYNMLWVALGLYFGGLGWVGFQKVDPCPCLVRSVRRRNSYKVKAIKFTYFTYLLYLPLLNRLVVCQSSSRMERWYNSVII